MTRAGSKSKQQRPQRANEGAPLDRSPIVVSPEAYAEFVKRLNQPAKANERLRRTMRAAVPWKSTP